MNINLSEEEKQKIGDNAEKTYREKFRIGLKRMLKTPKKRNKNGNINKKKEKCL